MARWRLSQAHYLNVPGTEWEHKEVSQASGKQARKVYFVPQFLNPMDPADQNYPGEIIVCHEGRGQGKDIIFVGDPTPDMEPLDNEAEAITRNRSQAWVHPIESMPSQGEGGYYTRMMDRMQEQIEILSSGQRLNAVADPASVKGVNPSVIATMQEQIAALIEQNARLQAQIEEPLEAPPPPSPQPQPATRRV